MRGSSSWLPAALAAASLLAGCTSLPNFSGPPGFAAGKPRDAVPKVSDVVTHIQCEIVDVIEANRAEFTLPNDGRYVVFATLLIEVTDDGSLNPSVSFIHPFTTDGTSRALGFKGQWDGASHRTYSQTFSLVLDPVSADAAAATCRAAATPPSDAISGSLGIAQVLAEGMRHASADKYMLPFPVGDAASAVTSTNIPTFGSTIDFTVTYGLGADPLWTLTHFTGPGGGGSGLLSYTRTSKDSLILSFAQANPPSPVPGPVPEALSTRSARLGPSQEAALRAAQDNATRMILLNILPQH